MAPEGSQGIVVDVEGLKRLTVLVGPNASGKTALLETAGYLLAAHQDIGSQALATSLLRTLRPSQEIPEVLVVSGQLGEISLSSLYIEARPRYGGEKAEILRLLHGRLKEIDEEEIETALEEADKIGAFQALLQAERRPSLRGLYKEYVREADEFYIVIREILRCKDFSVEWSGTHRFWLTDRYKSLPFVLRYISRKSTRIYVVHAFQDEKLSLKSLAISAVSKSAIIKCKGGSKVPGIAVFHPGFAYRYRLFETLYYELFKKTKLPFSNEAAEVLQDFIPWFSGFELVGRTLYVRTRRKTPVPVYALSDGQRAAAFLGMLYAAVGRDTLFLIDTPEAFVHPDGLPVMAELVARLAAEGGQVLVATQSLEFVEELLDAAREHGVLDDTVVLRLRLREGVVAPAASWSGEASAKSIAELGADLRG